MKHENILSTIGDTPVVKLSKLFKSSEAEICLKLERANPGGSIKDRIALAMIESAEKNGELKAGMEVIEPTSGNTGIGLAMVCAVKGYKLKLVMPESMSIERRRYMKALGAELVLTPKENGIPGAVEKAKELLAENKNAWMPQQFSNENNPRIHVETTAIEILNDFPKGLDYFITGVGTGGHITGCAKALKPKMENLKVYAVEPEESPVISGIGGGFIPKNLNVDLLDGCIQVSGEQAISMMERIAKEEGILVGISTGATLAAIESKVSEFKKGQVILGFCYDTGERYFSNEKLFT
ncbi:UNVERIFIED_CONTAM: hypothetical protein GTU68_048561 [Idotea baltica]|nr:hypothetical protein [Idotea baltica]